MLITPGQTKPMPAGEALIGLDVGEGYVSASRLAGTRDGDLRIQAAGWQECGRQASPRETAAAIRKLWRSAGLSTHTVSTCLRSRSLTLKHFRYPYLADEELRSALLLEAEETQQIARDRLCVDWYVNRREPASAVSAVEGVTEGILVTVPREEADRHLDVLREAGLYAAILDVGCMAAANLFLAMGGAEADNEAVCLLHMAGYSADIAVLSGRSRIYPRSLIARSETGTAFYDNLLNSMEDLLKYHQFKLHESAVTRVIVTGQVRGDGQMLSAIRTRTGLPVEFWNPLPRLAGADSRLLRSLESRDGLGSPMVASLGLAIRRN